MTVLSIFSLLFLPTVLTFVYALNEQDNWPSIWHETRRRWLKLMGALLLIAAITQGLTLISSFLA
jgi:hypothetical protein